MTINRVLFWFIVLPAAVAISAAATMILVNLWTFIAWISP